MDSEKLEFLISLKNIAKEAKLSSRHLYKQFNGIFAAGNLNLLKKPKVAIIGTRTPNQYVKQHTAILSAQLSQKGFVILSGGAIGIDSIAHSHSGDNSILVSPAGLNLNYPKENSSLIERIRSNALILSEYEESVMPRAYSFLERNRIIVILSDLVIIPQADLRSGSSSSANLCIALKKNLFVFPHRMNESLGTQELLSRGSAKAIYDIESFVTSLCEKFEIVYEERQQDTLLEFASKNGLFAEAMQKFGNQVLEYELEGKIKRNGIYIELG
ncbi:DNA processing protein DprA [Helicobacter sp. MIT 14-3879]|nr:DNA processing protein DprA [Helicobacter sp. MIT 14-3879]